MSKNFTPAFWTHDAIYCYLRGCRCLGCPIKKLVETHCFMKHTVLMLIQKYGVPTKDDCFRTNFNYNDFNKYTALKKYHK